MYPKELIQLKEQLQKLPGVGRKTAERYAFDLLSQPKEEVEKLSKALLLLSTAISFCSICHCIQKENTCPFCDNRQRDHQLLCLLSSIKDVYAIEQTKNYRGLYHVIQHLLSPQNGFDESLLPIEELKKRIAKDNISEIVLAFDATLEGDATALYIKQQLHAPSLKISRLALGIPMGSALDFIDAGTLGQALQGRQSF